MASSILFRQDGSLEVSTPYNRNFVEAIKALDYKTTQRSWNAPAKAWNLRPVATIFNDTVVTVYKAIEKNVGEEPKLIGFPDDKLIAIRLLLGKGSSIETVEEKAVKEVTLTYLTPFRVIIITQTNIGKTEYGAQGRFLDESFYNALKKVFLKKELVFSSTRQAYYLDLRKCSESANSVLDLYMISSENFNNPPKLVNFPDDLIRVITDTIGTGVENKKSEWSAVTLTTHNDSLTLELPYENTQILPDEFLSSLYDVSSISRSMTFNSRKSEDGKVFRLVMKPEIEAIAGLHHLVLRIYGAEPVIDKSASNETKKLWEDSKNYELDIEVYTEDDVVDKINARILEIPSPSKSSSGLLYQYVMALQITESGQSKSKFQILLTGEYIGLLIAGDIVNLLNVTALGKDSNEFYDVHSVPKVDLRPSKGRIDIISSARKAYEDLQKEAIDKRNKGVFTKLNSGEVVFFPDPTLDKEDEYENAKAAILREKNKSYELQDQDIIDKMSKDFSNTYSNSLLKVDLDHEVVIYINDRGEKITKQLQGMHDFGSSRDWKYLLESTTLEHFRNFMDQTDIDIIREMGVAEGFNRYSDKILPTWYIKYDNFRKIIDRTIQTYEVQLNAKSDSKNLDGYRLYRPSCNVQLSDTYSRLLAIVKKAAEHDKIKIEVEEQENYINTLTPKDCPKVPHIKPEIMFYPHQAQTLAVTSRSEVSTLDVDTGGGKLLLLLSDVLTWLDSGKVKKPLIIMPTALIAQQKREMESFTDGTVNIVVISTDSVNEEGQAEIGAIVDEAPPNTIFVSSYDWIADKYEEIIVGYKKKSQKPIIHKIFTRAQWFKSLGIDYVALDESHHIKNPDSNTSQAIQQMAFAKVRRLATGTLVPNNPGDLPAQMSFLDPLIFGDADKFLEDYSNKVDGYGKVREWRKGAQKEIREKIQKRGGVSMRESAWLDRLPPISYTVHPVKMSKTQIAVYQKILEEVIGDILSCPDCHVRVDDRGVCPKCNKLSKTAIAWLKYEDSDEYDEKESHAIIEKFGRLDIFTVNPKHDKFVTLLSPEEQISPKIAKIDELLDAHFADPSNGKAIIFDRYHASNEAILDNIKRKNEAVYYSGKHKKNLLRFLSDPNIRILVAVDRSLEEGANLQVANIIIRADLPWTPGSLHQSIHRAYRLKQDKPVSVHILLCEDTADICKYARIISKEHTNRKILSDFDDDAELNVITINVNNIKEFKNVSQLDPYQERFKQIRDQEKDEAKVWTERLGTESKQATSGKELPNSRYIRVPSIAGGSGGSGIDEKRERLEMLPEPEQLSAILKVIDKYIPSISQGVQEVKQDPYGNPTPEEIALDEIEQKPIEVEVPKVVIDTEDKPVDNIPVDDKIIEDQLDKVIDEGVIEEIDPEDEIIVSEEPVEDEKEKIKDLPTVVIPVVEVDENDVVSDDELPIVEDIPEEFEEDGPNNGIRNPTNERLEFDVHMLPTKDQLDQIIVLVDKYIPAA